MGPFLLPEVLAIHPAAEGGGGRIALYLQTNEFSGIIRTWGAGAGTNFGGPGTLYTRIGDESVGTLVYDNGGNGGISRFQGSSEAIHLAIHSGAGVSQNLSGTYSSLYIASNGWLFVTNYPLIIAENAMIEEGGGISADANGFPGGAGQGAGRSVSGVPPGGGPSILTGGGGGHGGFGASSALGAAGGYTYETASTPSMQGSGGGNGSDAPPNMLGGNGGGAIRLTVSNTFILNGRLSANGSTAKNRNSGGGSGGSVWVTASSFQGSGRISADGGGGNGYGGGGGGGRVAIFAPTNLFSGPMTAYGGASNSRVGGAGTIYLKPDISTSGYVPAELIIDNGGKIGTNSDSLGQSYFTLSRLQVRGGASAALSSMGFSAELMILSNSWVFISNRNAGFSISSNVVIQAGGGICADGGGYPSGSGPGPGRYNYSGSTYAGGGGGYGGYGGSGGLVAAYGGIPYGTMVQLYEVGSGGGMGGGTNYGGTGGGMLNLSVKGSLLLDGTLSANGLAGVGLNSGGGAGGSIMISAKLFQGRGRISANGGAGPGLGGGGGGGRVTISVDPRGTNLFNGSITAYGGPGANRGGAGVIYTSSYTPLAGMIPLLLIDNGGFVGTNTAIFDGGPFDVTVQNGGILSGGPSRRVPNFNNLVVGSNAWLSVSLTLSVSGNATVQAGGGIVADGIGYPPGQGPGAGRPSSKGPKGGGGYGGAGGGNPVYPAAGQTYGSFVNPDAPGSGGASSSDTGSALRGGAGGGFLRLSMSSQSSLLLDGRISANGGAGDQNSGGGSGGSVWVTTGTLLGSGSISADGGPGIGLGGGGGGGRILVESRTNLLTGPVTAFGAPGYARGGAGTVYFRRLIQGSGQVVLDNSGFLGTISSLGSAGSFPIDLTVKGNAVLGPPLQATVQNLSLIENGWIVFSNRSADSVTVLRDAFIDASSGITGDGTGFASSQGPGRGTTLYSSFGYTGSGAGHGGFGGSGYAGNPGGVSYDTIFPPVEGGSGGGAGQGTTGYNEGGAGGGLITFAVFGTLVNDGLISANGLSGIGQSSGGGSGGGVGLRLGILKGSGVISANGGAGNGLGGGGSGGMISLLVSSNLFAGTISAFGGAGYVGGGAGTIFTTRDSLNGGRLTIDNDGQNGAKTAVSLPSAGINVFVQNGGALCPAGDYLVVSNLTLREGGLLTSFSSQTNLDVAVLDSMRVASNALVSVNGKGFAQGTGPGAGLSTNGGGSGAGYGAQGGPSSVLPGGPAYGSVPRPVDFGSGGGPGFGPSQSASEGGGAVRLDVAGTLTVEGSIQANGNSGLQDSAGGGSGGSIFIAADTLEGAGSITANGGSGEVFQGGGGAGGRLALYARTNSFTGQVVALGAEDFGWGENGSIFSSSSFEPPVAIGLFPNGIVSNGVSYADLEFNTPMLLDSVDLGAITLTTPTGVVDSTNFVVRYSGASTLRFEFPLLSTVGEYTFAVQPGLATDIFGQQLSQAYTAGFSIALPLLQGVVTDTNGQPIPGVLLQPSIGSAAISDANGLYSIGAPPGISFTLTPSLGTFIFVPASRAYSGVAGSLTNQDFLAVTSITPVVSAQPQGTNLVLRWTGIPGVAYQVFSSTDLVTWVAASDVFAGANAPMQYLLPIESDPWRFYRLSASNP